MDTIVVVMTVVRTTAQGWNKKSHWMQIPKDFFFLPEHPRALWLSGRCPWTQPQVTAEWPSPETWRCQLNKCTATPAWAGKRGHWNMKYRSTLMVSQWGGVGWLNSTNFKCVLYSPCCEMTGLYKSHDQWKQWTGAVDCHWRWSELSSGGGTHTNADCENMVLALNIIAFPLFINSPHSVPPGFCVLAYSQMYARFPLKKE